MPCPAYVGVCAWVCALICARELDKVQRSLTSTQQHVVGMLNKHSATFCDPRVEAAFLSASHEQMRVWCCAGIALVSCTGALRLPMGGYSKDSISFGMCFHMLVILMVGLSWLKYRHDANLDSWRRILSILCVLGPFCIASARLARVMHAAMTHEDERCPYDINLVGATSYQWIEMFVMGA